MSTDDRILGEFKGGVLHLTSDEVACYLDNVLDQNWTRVVENHMQHCVPCNRRVEEAKQDLDVVHYGSGDPVAAGQTPSLASVPTNSSAAQWIRNNVERLAEVIANSTDRCIEWSTSLRFVPQTTTALSLMGNHEERQFEATLPMAVKTLCLPEQFDTLKVVLEDEGGSTAKLSLLLEPDLLVEESPSRIVEVRAEVRDRTGRLLARLPLVLRPGIQNRSKPVSVRLGSDPGEFEGTLSVVLCEVLPDMPPDGGE